MKANTKYNTLKGSASADISNLVKGGDTLEKLVKSLIEDFNFERYEPIGLSILGSHDFNISLILVDKEKSKPDNKYIVRMITNITKKDFKLLFRYFNVVLYSDEKYSDYKIEEDI